MAKPKFAVIFDMDGVLVDSTKHVTKSFDLVLRRYYGIKMSTSKRRHGLSLKDNVKIWNMKYGTNIDPIQFSKKTFKIQIQAIKKLKPDKSLLILLNELIKRQIPLGVGTSSSTYGAEEILNILKLRKYFSAIAAAEDVKRHKPHPDVFLAVAKKLKVKPENCVVFEDAVSGIQAAKAGYMKAIGYLTKYNTKKSLKNSDIIISKFSEISYKKIADMFK